MTELDKKWSVSTTKRIQKMPSISSSSVVLSVVVLAVIVTLANSATVPARSGPLSSTGTQNRRTSSVMHQAFANAGRANGLQIWRIENFEPVAYPVRDYGKFFSGDSYIVLNTRETKGVFSWDIHFWLGSETSADEAGSAAYYTVQVDDQLNGVPVQHREVQHHESQLFLSYFKSGIRYENGGVASGFNQVEINAAGQKRLFQVKGKKNVRVNQVHFSFSSMNKGDCFLLDTGRDIYVYVGPNAKRVEKLKAISAANQIRDQDHNGRAHVHIIDEFSTPTDQEQFFQLLGSGSYSTVPEEAISEEDAAFERNDANKVVLYKVSDAAGTLKVDVIGQKPLRQDFLNTNDCFILDTGSGIYVWVGRRATPGEKTQSLVKANGFLTSKQYPSWTQVHRIVENSETTPFKQYFSTWRDLGMTHTRLIRAALDEDSDSSSNDVVEPNIVHAIKKSGGRAIGFMPDNGEGEVEIWRIEHMNLASVDPETYGMFFGGDSYVIKYEYRNKRGGSGTILYYWQGNQSSIDEKAASAIHTVRLDNEMNGHAIQVRVTQGHEPRHFLKIFKGKFIQFTGGHSAGFKNIHDHDTYDVDGTRLFRIRGSCKEDVRAEQLPEVAASLASDDVFILETPKKTYIWNGKGGSTFEKTMSANIVNVLSPGSEQEFIEEGHEPEAFWSALGGRGVYCTELEAAPFLDPRLFHCKILKNGKFSVEEVGDFTQHDLDQDDIMVIDGGDEVYVWVGHGSTNEEKAKSIDMAEQYIRTDPTDRSDKTVPIIVVHEGAEERSFKRLFPSWDDSLWKIKS